MPIGKRPTPKVAKGPRSPRFDTSSGNYKGKSGTKKPTGNRPVPTVAKNHGTPSKPPARPSYPKATPMPTPKRDWNTRGGSKGHGGNG